MNSDICILVICSSIRPIIREKTRRFRAYIAFELCLNASSFGETLLLRKNNRNHEIRDMKEETMTNHPAYLFEQKKFQEVNIVSTRGDTDRNTDVDSNIVSDLPSRCSSATVETQMETHAYSTDTKALAAMQIFQTWQSPLISNETYPYRNPVWVNKTAGRCVDRRQLQNAAKKREAMFCRCKDLITPQCQVSYETQSLWKPCDRVTRLSPEKYTNSGNANRKG